MNEPLRERVLVTGAAVRIGRAIAVAFAQGGATVAVHCHRSTAAAAELRRELEAIGPGHVTVCADLADPVARARLFPDLIARGFTPTCLVNNASHYRRTPLLDLTDDRWQEDYAVNALAPFQLMRDFRRLCGHGCIINLLDQRVATVDPSAGAYGLAKKTLRDLTEAAAVQWAPEIRVNGVAPGFVLPPPGVAPAKMARFLGEIPLRRSSTPEEVAQACLFLARSPTVTGQILFVDGGLHLAPRAVAERDP